MPINKGLNLLLSIALNILVAKAFMQTEPPPIQIRYIKIITFPKMPTVVIIDIEEYNSDREIQLFYATDGKLLQSLDVSGGDGEIYPELFE